MLWYKAWHESKSRFLFVLTGMLLVSFFMAVSYERWGLDLTKTSYNAYVWLGYYQRFFHIGWVFSVLFLSLGGLLAERNRGTALFTLALPVRRRRIFLARAGVGMIEAFVLALVPSLGISTFAPLAGQHYPLIQAVQFALLLAAGCMVFYCLGLLLSTVSGHDWLPLAAGIALITWIYTSSKGHPALRHYNPQELFSGSEYIRAPEAALIGAPWAAIAVSLLVAAALVAVAATITEKLEV